MSCFIFLEQVVFLVCGLWIRQMGWFIPDVSIFLCVFVGGGGGGMRRLKLEVAIWGSFQLVELGGAQLQIQFCRGTQSKVAVWMQSPDHELWDQVQPLSRLWDVYAFCHRLFLSHFWHLVNPSKKFKSSTRHAFDYVIKEVCQSNARKF